MNLTVSVVGSVRVKRQSHFEAAQLFVLATQDALHTVVPVSQPVGQIHVGQVEVGLRQSVRALRRHTGDLKDQRHSDDIVLIIIGKKNENRRSSI